jgi:hypothetical protein
LVVEKDKVALLDQADIIDDLPQEAVVDDDEDDGVEEAKDDKKGKYKGLNYLDDSLLEVTEANISQYSIEDVVMPVVGFRTRMPNNEDLQKTILDIMAEDGIDMS